MRDVAAVAATVDAAIEAGATSLEGVAFRAANPEAARREALAGAVEDAMASAHRVARASGLVLGSIRSIRELDAGGPVPMARLALMEAKAADTPVLPGTTEVTASVEVSWDVAADRGA